MTIAAVVLAAALGALAGSVLTVVAWRIPRAIPLLAGRGTDGVPVPDLWSDVPLLRRRFSRDDSSVAVAVGGPVLELTTAVLFALLTWRFGMTLLLPAYLVLATAAVLLGIIDLQHQRLPNAIVGPFAVAGVVLVTLATAGTGAWDSLLRGAIGAALLFVLYLILALISPASLGMGDVKLAGVLGFFLAYLGWRTLALGGAGAFVLAALVGIVLLTTGRANRRTQVPFGPSMLVAALTAVILSLP